MAESGSIETLHINIKSSSAGSTKAVNTLIKTLERLEKKMAGLNIGSVATQLGTVKTSADGAAASLSKVAEAASGISKGVKSVNITAGALNKTATQSASVAKSAGAVGIKLAAVMLVVRKVSQGLGSAITKSNEYIENMNLFTVSMGEFADEAKEYAETVSDVMGIDPSAWVRNQGIFMTLATGFGIAGDRANTMSRNLTQLGYDLSSFFNISVEDAMQKLQSGLAGELEPLRRLGYDLSQAQLEAVALSLGIDKSVASMTRAEKAELSYVAMLQQVSHAQGDLARTLDQPANQLRILRANIEQAGRAIGNIFQPMLSAVLPYLIAAARLVKQLADSLASFFGFEMPEFELASGGIASVGEELEQAAGSAKKFKAQLLGIDELNVMNEPGGGAGSGSGLGAGFGFELPEYEFMSEETQSRVNDIMEGISSGIQDIKEKASEAFNTMRPFFEDDLENWKLLASEFAKRVAEDFTRSKTAFEDMAESMGKAWDEHGGDILDGLVEMKAGFWDTFWYVYNSVVSPVTDALGERIDRLWNSHLKPLWDSVVEFLMSTGENALHLWNKYLKPFIDWVGKEIAPVVRNVLLTVGQAVSTVVGFVSDILQSLLTTLDGIITFITGVFTGDWKKAWEGVVDIFVGIFNGIEALITGVVNTIITVINAMIRGVVQGVNTAIRALNRIDIKIPSWVPLLGGKGFDINIRELTAPEIPLLASGGMPSVGQMFIARESGPEMVGRIGNQSVVANNAQIVAGIKQGVYEAMTAANGGREYHMYLSGREVMVAVAEEARREEFRTGVNPLGG